MQRTPVLHMKSMIEHWIKLCKRDLRPYFIQWKRYYILLPQYVIYKGVEGVKSDTFLFNPTIDHESKIMIIYYHLIQYCKISLF
jgi:hypothetical protein